MNGRKGVINANKVVLNGGGGCGLGRGGVNKYNSTLDGVVYFTHRQITN